MLFLLTFMRKVKSEPRQGYARIYHTQAYPLGIRSLKRPKGRAVIREQK